MTQEQFNDYFFEATKGRNDVRREKITSAIHQAVAEERKRLVGEIEKSKITINHTKECKFQKEKCNCGAIERYSYNKALTNLLSSLEKEIINPKE